MNMRIFFLLRKAIKKEKIFIPETDKDFQYIMRKRWLIAVDEETTYEESYVGRFKKIRYKGRLSITDKGRDEYLNARNSWIKWILGTIISVSIAFASLVIKALLEC
ncbi:hypothetical protein [Staphylococcus agnetis]|uniref:hypothetical protein n=1 Tax=Staphylococcus agnetis TaxID=985762 RepID=UPI00208FA091|nr:hypothetical protein [Staphylococcus agnetis]MCO4338431.1 hypothetical protein [Staphylococcus agnetis]MCO4347479.1 hypothetical protein [Staphylococcus agnetis]